jgi:hypothetical protein
MVVRIISVRKKRWTSDEINYLMQNYPTANTKELVIKLHRSWSSIVKKAQRLGLQKTRETLVKIKFESTSAYNVALETIQRIKNEVSSKDLCYIAGFFDAEGCLSLDKRGNKYRNFPLRLQVTISNNNRNVLEWIRDSVRLGKVYSPYEKGKKCYTLKLFGWQAFAFLISLLPFLKVKYKDAIAKLSKWIDQYKGVVKDKPLVVDV